MNDDIYISAIAAAYNEIENLRPLVEQLDKALSTLDKPYEMIIVNDASTDGSETLLKELQGEFPALRVIRHLKNAGQTAGLDTGFRVAKGRYLATLDADLQNDPADIPMLLEPVAAGRFDFSNGWRKDRNDPWIRLVSTRIANGVRNWLTHENIHDSACGLKVFRRECVERLKMFNGMHRFLPTLVKMEGYTVTEIPVHHRARTAGVSKYGISNRLFKALRDTFAIRWMRTRIVRPEFKEEA